MAYELSFFAYVELLKKWRRINIILVTATVLLTIGYSVLRPTIYMSTVTLILKSEETYSGTSALGSLLAGLSGGTTTSGHIVVAIVNSRRMAKDMREYFKSYTKPLWWDVDVYPTGAGLRIDVKGPGPELTKDMANFFVDNLNKINEELNLTLSKPMVKVLDAAEYGVPQRKKILRNTIVAGIFSFVFLNLYIFLQDYFKSKKAK